MDKEAFTRPGKVQIRKCGLKGTFVKIVSEKAE